MAGSILSFYTLAKQNPVWTQTYFGDILIDDRSYNLKNFNGKGILFTSPHNVNTVGFERANSWLELGEKLS